MATREIPVDVELPWEVIDPLIRRDWLVREHARALRGERSAPCGVGSCSACGAFVDHCVANLVADRRAELFRAVQAPETAEPAAEASGPEPAPPRRRYRARFEKLGRSRFLGHLDLVRAMTMALRRAGAALAYSQGFKPRPRLSFSPALGLGVASRAEYMDFETTTRLDVDDFRESVNRTLPEGLRVTALAPVDAAAEALQDVIRRASYRVRSPALDPAAARERAADFLARAEWVVTRRREREERTLDIRPFVADMGVADDGSLRFSLVFGREGSARPAEVVAAVLGDAGADSEILRVEQYAEIGGRLVSPLVAVGRRPHD